MHWLFGLLALATLTSGATLQEREPILDEIAQRYTKRTPGGIHIPIIAKETTELARRGVASAIGLGDAVDVAYTVLMTVGGIASPLILDTGSSDLWIMSDACTQGCDGEVAVYPQASFRYSGLDVDMAYGDSSTGTFASGEIGEDTVALAGISLGNQYFAAINRTNTSVVDVGAAGIFGLGFPINSVIWNNVFSDKYKAGTLRRRDDEVPLDRAKLKLGSPFPGNHFRRTKFPTLPGILTRGSRHAARQTSNIIPNALASYGTLGPFLSRLVADSTLSQPMFSVTLQRDSIDVGGNRGMLSIGELPTDVSTDNLTWVPLRKYTEAEGGLPAPASSPNEVYPIAWEVMLDGVYFDGKKLPNSTLSSSSIGLSALIDTGNSLLRGPADIVESILKSLGNTFSCSESHTIAFEIGGKMFPVDPRDFIGQAFVNNVESCTANLVSTDPPQVGGYQFSWSLGTPFLKGVLSSYYYGNLSLPSVDAPKMGFLSTVPSDASQLLADAVAAATKAGKNYPAVTEAAPSGTITPALTNADKVTTATASASANAARRRMDGTGAGMLGALLAAAAACVVPLVL